MSSPAVPVTAPLAPSTLLLGAPSPSPSSFLLPPPPPPPTMVSPDAQWHWGGGGGGRRRGRSLLGGRSALPLPLVPGAVAAAARPTAGTPALTRTPLSGGPSPGKTPLSVSRLHPAPGRSILALPCSHFILRCFACGKGDRPSLRLRELVVV